MNERYPTRYLSARAYLRASFFGYIIKDSEAGEGREIDIKVNGKIETLDNTMSILEFVQGKGLQPDKAVVGYNFQIIPREQWHDILQGYFPAGSPHN